jgi:hypothetical protein
VLIHRWKPWLRASGPKTARGKAVSGMNAQRHGLRSRDALAEARQLRALIRQCREMM